MDHNNLNGHDEDIDESQWDSPATFTRNGGKMPKTDGKQPNTNKPTYQEQQEREASLRQELQSVRQVNEAIEGVIHSLGKARDNMKTVNSTVSAASTLLNTWTRILSQTEHNQRLILDPSWQGASQDIADLEEEAALENQRASERREAEEERKRVATNRAEEEERRKAEATSKQSKVRSSGRRVGVAGRGTSTSSSSYVQMGGSSAANTSGNKRGTGSTRRTTSGIGRGVSSRGSRGRG